MIAIAVYNNSLDDISFSEMPRTTNPSTYPVMRIGQ